MNRLLTCTAVALILGLTPALAEEQMPADQSQNPSAAAQPAPEAQSSEAMPSDESQPADPAAPIPGDSSQASPEALPAQPGDASPPAQSSEAQPVTPAEPSASPPAQSSEAPESITPAEPKAAEATGGAQFLNKQESNDLLASNLIGQSVYNSQDEVVGDINDLVTDESGKVIAVVIGSGGFLGLGQKDIAIRFEDLKLTRDENDNVKAIANVSKETLASAPDYETLSEQKVTIGKSEREDMGGQTSQ